MKFKISELLFIFGIIVALFQNIILYTILGIIIGFRTYQQEKCNNHVLYLPFVDICLTIIKEIDESS